MGKYPDIKDSNFYNKITIKGCNDEIIKDDNIIIPEGCEKRTNNIQKYKKIGQFEIYVSPCRIGRNSNYCKKHIEKHIEINNSYCKIVDNAFGYNYQFDYHKGRLIFQYLNWRYLFCKNHRRSDWYPF